MCENFLELRQFVLTERVNRSRDIPDLYRERIFVDAHAFDLALQRFDAHRQVIPEAGRLRLRGGRLRQ